MNNGWQISLKSYWNIETKSLFTIYKHDYKG